MNNNRIDSVIREHADSLEEVSPGYWRYVFLGRQMLTVTDEMHNRMRVICPIQANEDVSPEVLRECMSANFDRTLDARYCLSGDYLWGAFIHPLEELSETQYVDAMKQVAALGANFGTTFTSGDLLFGEG